MTITEFSDQFDVLYNNITSNQAPGLNEYEKSLFLTKAEKEIVKNYFTANSTGNTIKQGFDDSAKRQADFSILMRTGACTSVAMTATTKIDERSKVFSYPDSLSGGQKRKLCTALALIGNSKIILLDEPTSGMDVMARRSLWEFLKNYKKKERFNKFNFFINYIY